MVAHLVVWRLRLITSVHLLDNAIGIGGPDKGLGFAVVLAEVPVDRGLEVDQRVEDAALHAPAGERGEEGLNCVDGRQSGGRPL
jgi:hypothetical protein